jgi:hypothetical protein
LREQKRNNFGYILSSGEENIDALGFEQISRLGRRVIKQRMEQAAPLSLLWTRVAPFPTGLLFDQE